MKSIYIKILAILLRLDQATLKSDGKAKRLFIKATKPMGFWARKKYYNLVYK